MKRCDTSPLKTSLEIYQAVHLLQLDDLIPAQVYIHDYADDTIPEWTVAERKQRSSSLLVLTVIDPATPHTLVGVSGTAEKGYVGIDVCVMPTRTLSSPVFLWYPGCEHAGNTLCDIRQEARKIAERIAGVPQGCYEPRPGYGRLALAEQKEQSMSDTIKHFEDGALVWVKLHGEKLAGVVLESSDVSTREHGYKLFRVRLSKPYVGLDGSAQIATWEHPDPVPGYRLTRRKASEQ